MHLLSSARSLVALRSVSITKASRLERRQQLNEAARSKLFTVQGSMTSIIPVVPLFGNQGQLPDW